MSGEPSPAERVAAWRPHAAVVFGSGLAASPAGAVLDEEIGYEELGWPRTAVPGHLNVLRLVRVPGRGRHALRLALACGRPHRYEGWMDTELEAPVRGLAAVGVRRLVLTNSCGGLRPGAAPGAVIVCREVVDLQRAPEGDEPPRLSVCADAACARVAAGFGGGATATTGTYVAVAGPQFETPAEAAWLAGYGDVVGMSAAPEARAAGATGVECCLLALVANQAAAVGSHADVLAAGRRLAGLLASRLVDGVLARWPELEEPGDRRTRWSSYTT